MHYNAAFVHSVEWSALTDLAVLGIAAAATGAKWSSAGAAAAAPEVYYAWVLHQQRTSRLTGVVLFASWGSPDRAALTNGVSYLALLASRCL